MVFVCSTRCNMETFAFCSNYVYVLPMIIPLNKHYCHIKGLLIGHCILCQVGIESFSDLNFNTIKLFYFTLSLLTFILLTWTIWRAPTKASKWRMEFNSAFKALNLTLEIKKKGNCSIERDIRKLFSITQYAWPLWNSGFHTTVEIPSREIKSRQIRSGRLGGDSYWCVINTIKPVLLCQTKIYI